MTSPPSPSSPRASSTSTDSNPNPNPKPTPPQELPTHLPDPYVRGSSFKDLAEARQALIQYTVARGLSYRVRSSERRRYLVVCRSDKCKFRIRIQTAARTGLSKTTVSVPHTCPPETHQGWKPAVSVKYLQPKHQAIFSGSEQRVKPKQIMEIEKARGNEISYMQAWRTVKAAEAAAGANGVQPPASTTKSKRGRKPKTKDPNPDSNSETSRGARQQKQSKTTDGTGISETTSSGNTGEAAPAKEAPVKAESSDG